MKNTKYQIIKFTVNAPNEKVKLAFDTNNLYSRVDGLFVSLAYEDAFWNSTFELSMNGEEIFPTDFDVRLVSTNQSCPPAERFFDLSKENIPANGNHAVGCFSDGGKLSFANYPYQGSICLKLSNPPKPADYGSLAHAEDAD